MTAYVFVGPTLIPAKVSEAGDFVCLPPVTQGDVYRAVLAEARVIGIIDGYFDGLPAVWHKEILWAISQGVPVFGSASMGALRGAELCSFGMRGVGRIFEDYRDGHLEDDDEVAVLHGPAEAGYVALSEPMVNIRATLEKAVAEKVIFAATGEIMVSTAKGIFYQDRSWEVLFSKAASTGVPGSRIAALREWLPGGRVDLKAEDAVAMLAAMAEWIANDEAPPAANFEFEWTDAWDTATAVARTVGLDPAEDLEPLPPGRLLDELRLDGDRYRGAKAFALARLLALREADRRRLTAGRKAVSDAIDRLRSSHALYRRTELDQWLSTNDLSAEGLAKLMEDEALLEACNSLFEPALTKPLLQYLRLNGDYARFAERARRKHAVLADLGFPDPEPADLGMAPPQLVRWYFTERLARKVPDDLDAFIETIGIADRSEFYRLLSRERLFLSNGESAMEG